MDPLSLAWIHWLGSTWIGSDELHFVNTPLQTDCLQSGSVGYYNLIEADNASL
jgi:hypothetical protein